MSARYDSKLPAAIRILSVVVSLGIIALNSVFLYYTYELEQNGCECAMNWRRRFMEMCLFLFVALGIANLLGWRENVWVWLLFAALFVAFVIVTREFVNLMKSKSCACAQRSDVFKVLDVWNMFLIFWLVLVVIRVIFVVSAMSAIRNDASGATVSRVSGVKSIKRIKGRTSRR